MQQSVLWGANLYPANQPDERIDFEFFINIRPLDDNLPTTIQNTEIQKTIRLLTEKLLTTPEEYIELDE